MSEIRESIECWLLLEHEVEPHVLLLQVAAESQGRHPAFWQPVTGGIEAGESPASACLREVMEETGIELDLEALRQLPFAMQVEMVLGPSLRKTLFYAWAGSVETLTVKLNPEEHIDYQVVPASEVEHHLYWPSNHEAWGKVRPLLSSEELPAPA